MKDTIWKWIAIVALGLILVNIGWKGWQAWQWKQSIDVRLSQLEQAVVSVHPELRQRPAPPPGQEQGPNQ